jgi:hypothetical protein
MAKKNNWFIESFKFGLGAGLGAGISTMIFIILGLAFFFPGLYLLSQERKKPKDKQNQSNIIGAYILMGLGVVFGMGIGAGFLFSNFMEDF